LTIHQPGKLGAGGARNYATRHTKADFYAFLDSDCIPKSNWLQELISAFEAFPDAAACGGPNEAAPDATAFQKAYEAFYAFVSRHFVGRPYSGHETVEVPHNPSRNVCYRAKVFKDVGGFRSDLFPGEDMALDLELRRQGHRLYFNPQASVFHYGPKDFKEFRRTMFAFGKIQGEFVKKRGIERKLQIVGLLFWLMAAAALMVTIELGAWAFVSCVLAILAIFLIRPSRANRLSFCLHSSVWFLGFLRGLTSS
jgi:GT2 family glycosyltransferase